MKEKPHKGLSKIPVPIKAKTSSNLTREELENRVKKLEDLVKELQATITQLEETNEHRLTNENITTEDIMNFCDSDDEYKMEIFSGTNGNTIHLDDTQG